MGKRKVSILEPAATAVAEIAFFIESKGLPQTAKKFVKEAFEFFEKISDEINRTQALQVQAMEGYELSLCTL